MRLVKNIITILIVITVLITCTKAGAQAQLDQELWMEDYAAALSLSEETAKPILINFTGSDWCVWCQRLTDEVFSQQEFIDYAAENFILLKIDFLMNTPQPEEIRNENIALMEKYGVQGFPTIVFIDNQENVLGITGYQPGGAIDYIEHLKELVVIEEANH